MSSTPVPNESAILTQPLEIQATAYVVGCKSRTAGNQYPEDVCAELKHRVVRMEDAHFVATETMVALTAGPLLLTPTSNATPSPYVLTADDLVIEPIDTGSVRGSGPLSIWSLGVVVGARGEPYTATLWASQCRADKYNLQSPIESCLGVIYDPLSNAPNERDPAFNNPIWIIPKYMGEPTITAVSGQQGIVSFIGENGEHGTFDLATKTWD